MFKLGAIAEGGWDAISNVASTIGSGAGSLISSFFPAAQREKVVSQIVAPAGEGTGITYRPVWPDAPSIAQSEFWADSGWVGSPYQNQYAIPTKIQESKELAAMVSPMKTDAIGGLLSDLVGGLEWGTERATEIKTAADEFMYAWGFAKREPIKEGAKETGASRGAVQHLNDIRSAGAKVMTTIKGYGSAFVEQVKGLFSLGFQDGKAQPGFAIRHELEPSGKTTAGLFIVIAIVAALYIFGKKTAK